MTFLGASTFADEVFSPLDTCAVVDLVLDEAAKALGILADNNGALKTVMAPKARILFSSNAFSQGHTPINLIFIYDKVIIYLLCKAS